MDELETTRIKLDKLYITWWKSNWAIARQGFLWVPAMLCCIPLTVWWLPNNTNIILFLLVVSSVSFYLFLKHKKIITLTTKTVNEVEKNLMNTHNLHYCGCDIFSHYFNPSEEKLWNTASNIYFDSHTCSKFEIWHNKFHKPYSGSQLGNVVATILLIVTMILAATLVPY